MAPKLWLFCSVMIITIRFMLNQIIAQNQSKSCPPSAVFVGNVQDYFAPEMVLATGHGFSLDWWTLGIFVSLGRIGRSKLNIWRWVDGTLQKDVLTYLHIGQTPWLIIWNEHSKREKNARTDRILLEFWALSSNFGIQIKPWSIHFFWQVRTHVGQATLRILQPDADLCANTQRIEEGRPVAIHGSCRVMSLSCLKVS